MPYAFKVGDKGKTRDGRDYRVIMLDLINPRPLVVAIMNRSDYEHLQVLHADGRENERDETGVDLLPLPPPTERITRWLVARRWTFKDPECGIYDYSVEADAAIAACSSDSLMPDGKPIKIELDILKDPRS